jgi:BNR repeat protein
MSLMSRFRRPIGVLVALPLALLFAFSSTIFAFAQVSLIQLSSDPFTNSTSQHKTELEPDTFASGSTFVSAFQVGRFFNGGASDIGFATSTNGGNTFTPGFLPGITTFAGGPYDRTSDPAVAFDAKHKVWLISSLGIIAPPSVGHVVAVDVLVSRSTDGGLTWGNPVVVDNAGSAAGHFLDKNWTVCDNTSTSPFFGNCYTEYDDNTQGDLIQMSTSSDGGLTWGAAMTTQNDASGIGGQPLVQPNGTVIVPIVGFAGNKFLILSFISRDGGTSWSKSFRVSEVDFRHPAGGIRAGIPLPSAEIDQSGKVYVVWSDCVFEPGCTASDLVLSTSTDGIHWSAVTRIPLDPVGSGVDHFITGLAVDKSTSDGTAHLVLTFYFYPVANCTASTCQLDVGFSTSADGGATWSSNTQIAGPMTLSWLPNTTQGRMVGDYLSNSFVGSPAFPAFAVASAPTSGGSDCFTATPNCNEAIFTVGGGLSVGGSANPASDQINASSNATFTSSSLTDQ